MNTKTTSNTWLGEKAVQTVCWTGRTAAGTGERVIIMEWLKTGRITLRHVVGDGRVHGGFTILGTGETNNLEQALADARFAPEGPQA